MSQQIPYDMLRVLPAALALLALAGCDLVSSDDNAFVGTWEGFYAAEVTVVSAEAQLYAGTDHGVLGVGGIVVRGPGPYNATLRSFEWITGADAEVVDMKGTWLVVAGDGSAWLNNVLTHSGQDPDAPGPYGFGLGYDRPDQYDRLDLTFTDRSVSIAERTVQTEDGPLTIGGTLTGQSVHIPADVPTALPPASLAPAFDTLTLAPDGTYTVTRPRWSSEHGTWAADGDRLTLSPLTFSDSGDGDRVFRLEDGALKAYVELSRPTPSPDQIATGRGLRAGSLVSATTRYVEVYEPLDGVGT